MMSCADSRRRLKLPGWTSKSPKRERMSARVLPARIHYQIQSAAENDWRQRAIEHVRRRGPLNFRQRLRGVAELVELDARLAHHRQEQTAHLAIGLVAVVEGLAGLDLPAAAADHHDRKLRGVVTAGHHAAQEQQHR